jgi:hypothetical protein
MVPNLFRVCAHHPPLLEANRNKVKRVMELFSSFNKVLDSRQIDIDF